MSATLSVSSRSDNRVALVLLLTLITALAFFVRVHGYYDYVFGIDGTRFASNDPWVHVRQVAYLIRHFPDRLSFDPFGAFPGGSSVAVAPLFDYLLALSSMIVRAITGSESSVDYVCAYAPPVFGAATSLATYWVARMMFGRAVGLLAALLIAITPGVQYSSSILGFTDHHVLEVLLSTLVIGLLLRSVVGAPCLDGNAGSNTIRHRRWRASFQSLAFGLTLWLYLTTWIGGSFLALIIAAWFVCQSMIEHVLGKRVGAVRDAALPGFIVAVALLIPVRETYPYAGHQMAVVLLTGAFAVFLPLLSRGLRRFRWSKFLFPVVVVTSGVICLFVIYQADPSLFDRVLSGLQSDGAQTAMKSIAEVRSLLWNESGTTLAPAWQLFATGFPLALVGLAIVLFRALRRGEVTDVLLSVWSISVLVAILGQMRFGYYAAVVVAILASVACFKAIENAAILPRWLAGGALIPLTTAATAPVAATRNDSMTHDKAEPRWHGLVLLVWVLLIAFVPPAYALSRVWEVRSGPSDAWIETLSWMRDNTPEPMGNAAAYLAKVPSDASPERFEYPDTAYGVTCWWDYGYWVTGIAHRIPNANPTQHGATEVAKFFTSVDPVEAAAMLRDLGSKYVIVNEALPMLPEKNGSAVFGYFDALVRWAGRNIHSYYESFARSGATNEAQSVTLYYPAYFQSQCVRLYLYGGAPYEPKGPVQIAVFADNSDKTKSASSHLVEVKSLPSYEEAAAFVSQYRDGVAMLVSDDPTRSCVPLDPIEWSRPVFDSTTKRKVSGQEIAEIRVFEVDRSATKPVNGP